MRTGLYENVNQNQPSGVSASDINTSEQTTEKMSRRLDNVECDFSHN